MLKISMVTMLCQRLRCAALRCAPRATISPEQKPILSCIGICTRGALFGPPRHFLKIRRTLRPRAQGRDPL
eukprot:520698-Pyramimonas_sp.AAC.1